MHTHARTCVTTQAGKEGGMDLDLYPRVDELSSQPVGFASTRLLLSWSNAHISTYMFALSNSCAVSREMPRETIGVPLDIAQECVASLDSIITTYIVE